MRTKSCNFVVHGFFNFRCILILNETPYTTINKVLHARLCTERAILSGGVRWSAQRSLWATADSSMQHNSSTHTSTASSLYSDLDFVHRLILQKSFTNTIHFRNPVHPSVGFLTLRPGFGSRPSYAEFVIYRVPQANFLFYMNIYIYPFLYEYIYIPFLYEYIYIPFLYEYIYIPFLYEYIHIYFLYEYIHISFLYEYIHTKKEVSLPHPVHSGNFVCQSTFHQMLHTQHPSFRAGTLGQLLADVPSGLNLTTSQEIEKNWILHQHMQTYIF
jgi:hypothetical protein